MESLIDFLREWNPIITFFCVCGVSVTCMWMWALRRHMEKQRWRVGLAAVWTVVILWTVVSGSYLR